LRERIEACVFVVDALLAQRRLLWLVKRDPKAARERSAMLVNHIETALNRAA